jgi:hypothetical protein
MPKKQASRTRHDVARNVVTDYSGDFDVLEEEILTHYPTQQPDGTYVIAIRVKGRLRIGPETFHWNKVLTLPIQRLNEATED